MDIVWRNKDIRGSVIDLFFDFAMSSRPPHIAEEEAVNI